MPFVLTNFLNTDDTKIQFGCDGYFLCEGVQRPGEASDCPSGIFSRSMPCANQQRRARPSPARSSWRRTLIGRRSWIAGWLFPESRHVIQDC